MKQFEVFIPVDFRITLTALNDVEAGDKAERVADTFLLEAKPYLLNIPGIGPVALEVVPVDEETDDTPDVFEVREVKSISTVDKLGRYSDGLDVVSGPSTPGVCPLTPRVTASEVTAAGELVVALAKVNPDAI